MILYPAIDLLDGKCVRLLRGDMNKSTIFHNEPFVKAKEFEKLGFKWLHIVDLDGAFAGKSMNSDAIKKIISSTNLSIQLGGGIRTLENVKFWFNKGISKVIIGTSAIQDPEILIQATKLYPFQISLGIDAKEGKVAINGWSKTSKIKAVDLVKEFKKYDLESIIYTDISRDGAMQGPNISKIKEISKISTFPIIASGGVSSMQDIINITSCHPNIKGIIVGRALYENAIDIPKTLKILRKKEC